MTTKTKTAGDGHLEAVLTLNLQPDFISEVINGQDEGARLIRELTDELCIADMLFREVQALASSPATLRGFCRQLQKHIEQGRA